MPSDTDIEASENASLEEANTQAETIIKKHVTYAMFGGAVPIPLVDLAAVTAVQLDMLKQLAALRGVELEARSTRTFVTSLAAALGSSAIGRAGASALKLIPGVGSLLGGAAQVIMTGASTFAIGNVFDRLFREGRPLDELSVDTLKDEAASYMDSGRETATELWDKAKSKVGR